MNNSKLMYRDTEGMIRVIEYGNVDDNLEIVKDQGALVTSLVSMGAKVPASPVLCLIY